MNDIGSLQTIVQLIANQKFTDYLTNIVETKLNILMQSMNIKSLDIYDAESLDSERLFEFLSSLWISFCQRINGPDASNQNGTTFRPNILQVSNP